tara:strand:- start:250 stop:450 length:201 start_codon:yes stop_codon:yes gene_type:complete
VFFRRLFPKKRLLNLIKKTQEENTNEEQFSLVSFDSTGIKEDISIPTNTINKTINEEGIKKACYFH